MLNEHLNMCNFLSNLAKNRYMLLAGHISQNSPCTPSLHHSAPMMPSACFNPSVNAAEGAEAVIMLTCVCFDAERAVAT